MSTKGELRTLVADAAQYHGNDMGARLAEVRERAAAVQLHAVCVALLALGKLGGPAEGLAQAASRLAAAAERHTDLISGTMISCPDYTELDQHGSLFRQNAVTYASQFDESAMTFRRINRAAGTGRAMRLASMLMPPAAGSRWFTEAQSFLSEATPEQRAKAVPNYLRTALQVITTTWATELSYRVRLASSCEVTRRHRDNEDDAHS